MNRTAVFLILVAAIPPIVAACGDDATSTTEGAGGTTSDGGIGGFDSGLGGMAGEGGTGGEGTGGHGQATPAWDAVFGGDGKVFPRDLCASDDGSLFVVGSYNTASGSVDLGGGALPSTSGDAIFVAKYDASGSHQWSEAFDGPDDQGAESVACDGSGNVWVSGQFLGTVSFGGDTLDANGNLFTDGFVTKLDADGNHLFSRAYGLGDNNGDRANAVAVDGSDNPVVAGIFQSQIELDGTTIDAAGGAGDFDMFVTKLDSTGSPVTGAGYGLDGRQEATAVAAASDGRYAVGGYANGDVDFGGGVLDNPGTASRAVVAVFDGSGAHGFSAMFAANCLGDGASCSGGDDCCSGACESGACSGSGHDATVTDLAFAPNGDLVVSGNFKDAIDLGDEAIDAVGANDDVFVARFDSAGTLVYGSRFGSSDTEKSEALAVDAGGFAYVGGWFKGTLPVHDGAELDSQASNRDAFVLSVGPPGQGFWGVQGHAMEAAHVQGIAVGDGGDVIVVGELSGELDLGSGPKGSASVNDLFIAAYTP